MLENSELETENVDAPTGPRTNLPDWLWIPILSAGLIALMVTVGWTSFSGG